MITIFIFTQLDLDAVIHPFVLLPIHTGHHTMIVALTLCTCGIVVSSVPAHESAVSCLYLSGDRLLSGSWDATVKVWQLSEGDITKRPIMGNSYTTYRSMPAFDLCVIL